MNNGDDDIQRYDFRCATNEDFVRILGITDKATGVIVPITGWAGYLSVYESVTAKEAAAEPLFALTPSSGLVVSDAGNGLFKATILQTAIAAKITVTGAGHAGQILPQKICVYDFLAYDADGVKMREMAGNFIFELGLTTGP